MDRSVVTRLIAFTAAMVASVVFARSASGVIVSGEAMERPDGGWVGSYNGSSCVAVGSHWFITARHVGGQPDSYVRMRDAWYRVVEIVPHAVYDAELIRVAEELPGYHELASDVRLGDPCLLGGYGATAGAALPDDAGYDWAGPHEEAWGANMIDGEGNLLAVRFDAPGSVWAVPHEAIFAVNDSGAGLFVYGPDGSLKLAGIGISVIGWGAARWTNAAFALNLDVLRNWMAPIVDPSRPVSSGVEAPRAMVGLPGMPGWVGGAVVVGVLAGLRRANTGPQRTQR